MPQKQEKEVRGGEDEGEREGGVGLPCDEEPGPSHSLTLTDLLQGQGMSADWLMAGRARRRGRGRARQRGRAEVIADDVGALHSAVAAAASAYGDGDADADADCDADADAAAIVRRSADGAAGTCDTSAGDDHGVGGRRRGGRREMGSDGGRALHVSGEGKDYEQDEEGDGEEEEDGEGVNGSPVPGTRRRRFSWTPALTR